MNPEMVFPCPTQIPFYLETIYDIMAKQAQTSTQLKITPNKNQQSSMSTQ